jgi:oxygen-dependent protoporphyrinogen oxidase
MTTDIILGAGVAGLVTAHHLRAQGRDVVVLEAGHRAGGVVRTRTHDGLVLEQGPQSLLATDAVLDLVDALGLSDRLRVADASAAIRYVLHQGALCAVPTSPLDAWTSPLIGPRALLRALAEPLVPRRRSDAPESVADLLRRRVGPRLLGLAEAAIGGVLAGDPALLDAEASFPTLVRAEREAGSLARGLWRRPPRRHPTPRGSVTLAGGLSTLIDALTAELGPRLRLRTPVDRLERAGSGWVVHADTALRAERVWVCTPPWETARLVGAPWLDVPAAPVAAVHLAWPREEVPGLRGFGWLAGPAERRDALGCLWVSSIFPGHAPGHALLRVMIGGARAPDLAALPDEELIAHARRVLAEVQGLRAPPTLAQVSVARPGIPQYPVGHARRVQQLAQPGLAFVGWGTSGIGLTNILDDAARQTTA